MRRRTKAREAAIQFLYQVDLRRSDPRRSEPEPAGAAPDPTPRAGSDSNPALDEFLDAALREGQLGDEDARAFARRLIVGTLRQIDEIDVLLREVARNWDLKRMAVVDRNVLRMAVFELLHCPDIPPKVTINEAIEIGKRYSTANSGAFINGLLDRIRLDHVRTQGEGTASGNAEAGG